MMQKKTWGRVLAEAEKHGWKPTSWTHHVQSLNLDNWWTGTYPEKCKANTDKVEEV